MREISYRKDFLDYVLFNYEFEDRVAVWILNFLKSHPVISKNISFIYDETIRRSLRIAVAGTGRPTLMFEKGNTVTVDGEVIFHELNMNREETLFLEFSFVHNDRRYEKVKEIEASLDSELEALSRDVLLHQIDRALDAGDEEQFKRLAEMLNRSK